MLQHGVLEGIFVAPHVEGTPEPRPAAQVEVGAGLVGDRHHQPGAPPDRARALTLFAAETFEHLARVGLDLAPGESRRQLLVRGVDLTRLQGRRLRVGEVVLEGTGPCRPCAHLEAMTRPGVLAALEGRGGLTARVVKGGLLRVGDAVVELPGAEAPDA
jgi:MOSC domain-containing protein YiiM